MDRPQRSFMKACSWRVLGTVDTIVVSWVVTGRLGVALGIGFVELFTKISLYFLHERMWARIRYGQD